jgi:hypothetical protein
MSADKTVPPAAEEKKEDNKSFDEDIKHSDPVEIRAEDTSKPFDVFLSHNWGNDTRGRDNHARVKILCEELESKGIKTWCDEYDMEGNILESMAKGMDQSKKVIVFVTKEYIKKANGEAERGTMDNVYREFNYISNHFQSYDITPVVMEEGVKCMSKWCGTFGISLIGQLYVDYTEDLGLSQCLETLQEFILGKREISYNDGSFYEGPVNDKMQRHGYGKLTDRHGNVYEGKFNEDKKDDRHASILYKKSGVKFEGRFQNDKICPSTRGTLTLKDGTVMKGSFVGSKKIGIFDGLDVTLTYAKSGNKYIGDIKANKIEGRGRMEYKDGAVYEGSWQNGQKHSKGEMNYQNGDVYSGQWKNNMRHGKGKLDLANHDRYIDSFRNDMMQGKKGTYLVANGSKYEGGFVKNQRCGNGTFTSEDDGKRVSCGQWKDDKLHGKGYREYSNGDKYYGYFKESQRNGEGEMLFASGEYYKGQWREGDMRQGVFDFEQVKRKMNRSGFYGMKQTRCLTKVAICFKEKSSTKVQHWTGLLPKRAIGLSLLLARKTSNTILGTRTGAFSKTDDFCKAHIISSDVGSPKKGVEKVVIKVVKKVDMKDYTPKGTVKTYATKVLERKEFENINIKPLQLPPLNIPSPPRSPRSPDTILSENSDINKIGGVPELVNILDPGIRKSLLRMRTC